MRLLHYDEKPVDFDPAMVYEGEGRAGKPHGLWVSVEGEDDWRQWCESEDFHLQGLDYVHEVTLAEVHNVLHITTPDELYNFHKYYCTPDPLRHRILDGNRYFKIDWDKVARDYDGIIIAPYQWGLRFDGPFWYYGWDCASGCIWNLDAIESVQSVTMEESK